MGDDLDHRRLFEASPNAYMVLDRELRFVAANEAYLRVTSRRLDELIGKPVAEVFPHDPDNPSNESLRTVVASFRRVVETGELDTIPFIHYRILVRRDGSEAYEDRYWSATHTPILDAAGDVAFVLQHTVDVTELHRANAEARRLAQVLDATPDFVGIADLEENPVFANHAALEMLGLEGVEAATRIKVSDYFTPSERARVRQEVLPTALRDGLWRGELTLLHRRTGEEIPVLYSVFPLRDAGGNASALATITRDLRDQKAGERERARLFDNERRARALAENANALMDQFLATVSHELRTPLTAILGWTQMMKQGMLNPEKRERASEIIERNARLQAHLIDDLLDVSRIIAGKLTVEMEETDIDAVVAAAVETVRPTAEAKGVRLELHIESSGAVTGDARRLQQVVWNLLANAVKFTAKGGHVELGVERSGGEIELTVRDTGSGIDPAFLPHVFERFRQAATGTTSASGGLGLGLSIVKYVVERHGGWVSAESEGLGHGATFRIRLPRRPSLGPSAVTDHDHEDWQPPAALEGMHVLVIDDERDTRDYVRALLEHAKARVTVAASAEDGLGRVDDARPDVILSDIVMPEEDGYSFVRRLRALPDPAIARTPAIALTAHARPEDRRQAMLAGFHNHVPKPIDRDELLAVVASFGSRPPK